MGEQQAGGIKGMAEIGQVGLVFHVPQNKENPGLAP